jgi:hypothetical protein
MSGGGGLPPHLKHKPNYTAIYELYSFLYVPSEETISKHLTAGKCETAYRLHAAVMCSI